MANFKKAPIIRWIIIFIFLSLILIVFWQKILVTKPALKYSAWIPSWDQERSLVSLSTSNYKLNFVSPIWYLLEPNGHIEIIKGLDLGQLKIKAKEQNVSLLPTVFNSFDPNRVSLIINNQTQKQATIDNLVKIAEENQYLGWDLDFEELKLADKDAFSGFVKDLAKRLHQKRLLLSVSVHVQKGDSSDRESARVQDWVALGKEADFVRIMAYDFHNPQTGPGPITPINNLKQVLRRAVDLIPLKKIVLGLPLYGYDWTQDGQGEPVDYQTMKIKAGTLSVDLTRDVSSQSLTTKYKENDINHTVFVEDSVSVLYKINLAKEFGIYQFVFWRLGGEDLSLWKRLP